jgi:outer membrane immunogenic protein
MRRIFSVIVAVLFSVGVAHGAYAQDILSMMYSPRPVASWTGVYIGGNIGYGWAHVDQSSLSTLIPTGGARPEGLVGGGQFGGNVQSGIGLFGFEGDFQATAQENSFVTGGTFLGSPFTFSQNARTPWFGTARLRAGIVADGVLFYATGGLAFGEVRNDTTVLGSLTGTLHYSSVRMGWAGGGGIEALLSPNWSVKVEYLHYDLGSFSDNMIVTVGGVVFTTANLSTKINNDIVRVGVNYFFR